VSESCLYALNVNNDLFIEDISYLEDYAEIKMGLYNRSEDYSGVEFYHNDICVPINELNGYSGSMKDISVHVTNEITGEKVVFYAH